MSWNMVTQMNAQIAFDRQNGTCKRCGAKLEPDYFYFILDQSKNICEAYCIPCGNVIEESGK